MGILALYHNYCIQFVVIFAVQTSSMLSEELSNLPKFADFARGDNSQLDAVSIQKYVARMVEVS